MNVIENLITQEELRKIQSTVTNYSFPWNLTDVVDPRESCLKDPQYNFQFFHTLLYEEFVDTQYISLFEPVLIKIPAKRFTRVKVNLTPKTHKVLEHGYHVDSYDKNIKAAVFYINTCDGYTKFKKGGKVTSRENKMILFDASDLHTGSTCSNQSFRLVLNINYEHFCNGS